MNTKIGTKFISIGYFIMVVVAISLYHTNVFDRMFLYWVFLAIIFGIAFLTMQICNARKDHHFIIEKKYLDIEYKLDKLELEYLRNKYKSEQQQAEENPNLTPTEQNEN